MLEGVAYPLCRGSSWPWNQTGVSCIAGRFFTSWAKGNISADSTPGPQSQAVCTTEMGAGSMLCQEQHPSVLEEYVCHVAQIFLQLFFHLYCNDFVSALFSTISELCCWTARPSGMHYHNRLISASLRQIWVRRLKQVGKAVGRVHDELRILTHSNSMGGKGEKMVKEGRGGLCR